MEGRARIAVIASLLCLLALPAGASAEYSPPALFLGPLRVGHGYTMTGSEPSCNKFSYGFQFTFTRHLRPRATEKHHVSGGRTRCRATRDLSSATLSVHMDGFAQLHLDFSATGRARLRRGRGCPGSGRIRRGFVTGVAAVAIQTKLFGTVLVDRMPAALERFGGNCRQPLIAHRTILFESSTNNAIVSAARFPSARQGLFASVFGRLRRHVYVSHSLFLSGRGRMFEVAPSLDTARIHVSRRLLSGTLDFTRDPSCHGDPGGGTGTVTGSIRLRLDWGGTVSIRPTTGAIGRIGSEKQLCGSPPVTASSSR